MGNIARKENTIGQCSLIYTDVEFIPDLAHGIASSSVSMRTDRRQSQLPWLPSVFLSIQKLRSLSCESQEQPCQVMFILLRELKFKNASPRMEIQQFHLGPLFWLTLGRVANGTRILVVKFFQSLLFAFILCKLKYYIHKWKSGLM